MKFQWIGTGTRSLTGAAKVVRIATLSMLLCGAVFAADDELPAPADTEATAPPPAKAAPSAVPDEDSVPAPSLGNDAALPEPSADRGQESSANQVNRPPEADDIFLPTPNVNDNVRNAPASAAPARVSADENDWRISTYNRPVFSLYGGAGFKSYSNALVQGARNTGAAVGASVRAFDISDTIYAHLYGGVSWYSLGDVGRTPQVKDQTLEFGPLIEIGIGRHFSLFGSVLRRQSQVSSYLYVDPVFGPDHSHMSDLTDVAEAPTWHLGVGAQWDFYVVPHASVGLHAQVEQDLFVLTLAFAIEPAPRKKLSLNFDEAY